MTSVRSAEELADDQAFVKEMKGVGLKVLGLEEDKEDWVQVSFSSDRRLALRVARRLASAISVQYVAVIPQSEASTVTVITTPDEITQFVEKAVTEAKAASNIDYGVTVDTESLSAMASTLEGQWEAAVIAATQTAAPRPTPTPTRSTPAPPAAAPAPAPASTPAPPRPAPEPAPADPATPKSPSQPDQDTSTPSPPGNTPTLAPEQETATPALPSPTPPPTAPTPPPTAPEQETPTGTSTTVKVEQEESDGAFRHASVSWMSFPVAVAVAWFAAA